HTERRLVQVRLFQSARVRTPKQQTDAGQQLAQRCHGCFILAGGAGCLNFPKSDSSRSASKGFPLEGAACHVASRQTAYNARFPPDPDFRKTWEVAIVP